MSSAPRPPPDAPSLTVRLNGVVRAIVPRQPRSENDGQPKTWVEHPLPLENEDEGEINAGEGGLLDDLENFLDKDNDEDAEDGPDWMFEEGEKLLKDTTYTFC